MKIPKAERAFAALAQASRLEIFKLLMDKSPEGLPAGTIAEILNIPATTLSFHLSQLNGAKLVESRKEGRSVIYSINLRRAKKLANFLTRKQKTLPEGTPENEDNKVTTL